MSRGTPHPGGRLIRGDASSGGTPHPGGLLIRGDASSGVTRGTTKFGGIKYFENMDSTQGHGTLSLCITEKWIRDRLNLQVDFLGMFLQ